MRHVLKRKVVIEGLCTHGPVKARYLDECFELAGKGKQPARRIVEIEKRLVSEPVAGESQLLTMLVPEREGEHAPEGLDEPCTLLLIQVHDALGVGARPHRVPGSYQPGAQVGKIVDLPVVDDPGRGGLVAQGLVSTGDINDAQAPVTNSHDWLR